MSKEISVKELALEGAELLPSREALGVFFSPNVANVYATSSALALNAVSLGSAATAVAGTSVNIWQG